MTKILLAVFAALAIALAGCGDEGSDSASGPASVIPEDMVFYFEATIRPEGEQAENLDELVSGLGELPLIGSVGDPRDFAIQQLEAEAANAGIEFSYEEDIEPWLGEKAGFGATEDEDGETRFVIALETTDEDAARESIESLLAQGNPTEEGEYEGVSYLALPDDSVRLGVFDGHVVFAPAADFEAAVDASGGESLGSADKFAAGLENLDPDRLASFYFDFARYEEFVTDPEDAEELEQAQAIFPEIFEGAISIGAGTSAGDEVYLEYSIPSFEGQPEAGASPLLESAAGDALGAFALEDIGAFGQPLADLFERANEAGADLDDFPEEGLEAAFEDETGIAFDDATKAIGDASLWVRGDLPDGLEVAGEIEASDPDAAAAVIEAIEREVDEEGEAKLGPPVGGSDVGFSALETVSGSGKPADCSSVGDAAECLPSGGAHAELPFVNIELDGDVIRYGFFADEQAASASDPESGDNFEDSETYAAGQEALGDDFEYLGAFDLAPVLDEAASKLSVGDALLGGSPEEIVVPFLSDKLGVVAFGVRYEDDESISRYVLQLAE